MSQLQAARSPEIPAKEKPAKKKGALGIISIILDLILTVALLIILITSF